MADLEAMLNKNKEKAKAPKPQKTKGKSGQPKLAQAPSVRSSASSKKPRNTRKKERPAASARVKVDRSGDARRPWQHDDRVEQATAKVLREAKVFGAKAMDVLSEAALAAANLAAKRELSWEIPLGDLNARVKKHVENSRKRIAAGRCGLSPLFGMLPGGLRSKFGI